MSKRPWTIIVLLICMAGVLVLHLYGVVKRSTISDETIMNLTRAKALADRQRIWETDPLIRGDFPSEQKVLDQVEAERDKVVRSYRSATAERPAIPPLGLFLVGLWVLSFLGILCQARQPFRVVWSVVLLCSLLFLIPASTGLSASISFFSEMSGSYGGWKFVQTIAFWDLGEAGILLLLLLVTVVILVGPGRHYFLHPTQGFQQRSTPTNAPEDKTGQAGAPTS